MNSSTPEFSKTVESGNKTGNLTERLVAEMTVAIGVLQSCRFCRTGVPVHLHHGVRYYHDEAYYRKGCQ